MHRTHHAHDERGTVRRGFSLIEVMMATVILGLGILGLLALFAGTARQQQIASEATDSLLITGNAQAIVGSQVGAISALDPDPVTGQLSNFEPDVWYAMTAEGINDNQRQLGPRSSPTSNDAIFFLRDVAESGGTYTLYSGSPDQWAMGNSQGFCGGPASASGQFAGGSFLFSDNRLDPCSILSIEVDIVQIDTATNEELDTPTSPLVGSRTYVLTHFGTATSYVEGATAYFIESSQLGDPVLFPFPTTIVPGPCGQFNRPVAQRPGCPDADRDFIAVSTFGDPGADNTNRAFVSQLNIPDLVTTPSLRVRSITAQASFQFRQTDVVSLSSRLDYTVGSDGRRVPEFGYSLLFRLSDDGRTEVMVASYAIRPTQAGTEFVPMEDFMSVYSSLSNARNSDGPLRQVPVELGYDMTEEMHYIEVASADNFWAVEPGNVVLVQGNATNGATPGSELSTTVVSQRVIDDTTRRGFLDRAPRNNGSILLPDLNMTIDTFVWGVQPTVESEADESVWSLRAVAIEPISLSGSP